MKAEDIEDIEDIVNNTSNGILLHGLIHVSNEEDESYCVVAQDKLLENVNANQVRCYPLNEGNTVEMTFWSQRESSRFQERVNRTRHVIGGSAGLQVVGFGGLEIGLKREKVHTNILQQITKTNAYYLSQNQLHIKRKMSLQLRKDTGLCFTNAVYSSLDQIDKTFNRGDEYEKCKAFFITYGTHVDLGKCCLGGVAEIVSECRSVKNKTIISNDDEQDTKNIIEKVVKGGNAVAPGIFAAGKLNLTAEFVKQNQQLLGIKGDLALKDHTSEANIYGGNNINTDFQAWGNSLNQPGSRLHVIDRGCLKIQYMANNSINTEHQGSLNNHKSVWELLREPQHKNASPVQFNFIATANKLKVFYQTFLYRERIIELFEGIDNPPSAVEYSTALIKILRVNEWRKNKTGNLDEWGQFIIDDDDDTFLKFVEKMDSLSGLRSKLFTKICDTFKVLMEQVGKDEAQNQKVKNVKKMIDGKVKTFDPKILANRDHIENVVAKNMYTEDGAAYSDALKTLLAGVDALPQDRNDSYWISMLKRKSVCKFLLKPTEYMVMTLQTFDEVCDTIINLTQSVNAAVAMPTNAQTTSLVFKQNRGVVEKIEFRANVRKCVDLARHITTAEDYKKALEDIQSEVNTLSPNARLEALTELLLKDYSIAAFLQKAGNMKMRKKTLSDVSDIVFKLLAYVDYMEYPQGIDIETNIRKQIEKTNWKCPFL